MWPVINRIRQQILEDAKKRIFLYFLKTKLFKVMKTIIDQFEFPFNNFLHSFFGCHWDMSLTKNCYTYTIWNSNTDNIDKKEIFFLAETGVGDVKVIYSLKTKQLTQGSFLSMPKMISDLYSLRMRNKKSTTQKFQSYKIIFLKTIIFSKYWNSIRCKLNCITIFVYSPTETNETCQNDLWTCD